MKLDDWQEEVMKTKGNIVLRSGRQVGKSTVISCKAAEFAAKNKKKTVLVIASVERQAYLLFEKILSYLDTNYRKLVKKGKDRPTKSRVKLYNGSIIYCLPTGLTGHGIRGYTINLLIADEAAFIPEEVWTAVTPMLAVTKGDIWLLSTPHGKGGYYYDCFQDESFSKFHVSSEECPRRDDKFLEREKARMTRVQYAQEYLGEFVDELQQFFPTELIKSCMTRRRGPRGKGAYYLGVDVARMGGDESTFEIVEILADRVVHIENQFELDMRITDSIRRILRLEELYKFKKIYIDDGGMGVGVLDSLLEQNETKRKVEGINNAKRIIDRDGNKKTLMKEALYLNLLHLMEKGKIELLSDPEIMESLKSVQYEYTDEGKMKIFGKYTHIVEGLVRACWCVKTKGLNIWITS